MNLRDLTSDEFRLFQEFIYKNSGIRMPETKTSLLSNRIRKRLRALNISSFEDYFRFLDSTKGELKEFLDVVTTNETFFFRTEKHFDWFRGVFIPQWTTNARSGNQQQTLRVWSAACSTGEEAYTLAICILENQLRLLNWKTEIVGTDISQDALASARSGIYSKRSIEDVNEKQARRYFKEVKNEPFWQVKDSLKAMVTFRQHNLMQPLSLPAFDCIFIRNVLIYFDRESKKTVVDNVISSLKKGGYLVVGPSEGIYDMLGDLKKCSPFLYQKC